MAKITAHGGPTHYRLAQVGDTVVTTHAQAIVSVPSLDVDGLTGSQLREELRSRELPTTGRVDELRARLRDAL